jgi:predicted AlkP superfamily pyrophosphatase or phosphodiesterase
MIYKIGVLLFLISTSLNLQNAVSQDQPERVVLVVIDGLHIDAPERLKMPNFTELAGKGTLIEKMCGIIPYHSIHGEYAVIHTSSYPNPMMMTGTIFLEENQKMLQHSFESSAFIANSNSYRSIATGYQFAIQKPDTDEFSINQTIELMERNDFGFIRVHMQNSGSAGSQTLRADIDKPYRHNIWHEDSPYIRSVEEADRQLGRFIAEMKRIGKWEGTLLVVTSDHGQTKTGWHPSLPEESWLFPTLFYGPGIKQNHTIEWADQTDLTPTIAYLMNADIPNRDGGSGQILYSAILNEENESSDSSKILEFNRVLARYILAEAKMMINSVEYPFLNSIMMDLERDFYSLNRIMDWKKMESIDALTKHNEQIVTTIEKNLQDLNLID